MKTIILFTKLGSANEINKKIKINELVVTCQFDLVILKEIYERLLRLHSHSITIHSSCTTPSSSAKVSSKAFPLARNEAKRCFISVGAMLDLLPLSLALSL